MQQPFIFFCLNDKQDECLNDGIFGGSKGPLIHAGIYKLQKDAPCFLYNRESKCIHGPFSISSRPTIKGDKFPVQIHVTYANNSHSSMQLPEAHVNNKQEEKSNIKEGFHDLNEHTNNRDTFIMNSKLSTMMNRKHEPSQKKQTIVNRMSPKNTGSSNDHNIIKKVSACLDQTKIMNLSVISGSLPDLLGGFESTAVKKAIAVLKKEHGSMKCFMYKYFAIWMKKDVSSDRNNLHVSNLDFTPNSAKYIRQLPPTSPPKTTASRTATTTTPNKKRNKNYGNTMKRDMEKKQHHIDQRLLTSIEKNLKIKESLEVLRLMKGLVIHEFGSKETLRCSVVKDRIIQHSSRFKAPIYDQNFNILLFSEQLEHLGFVVSYIAPDKLVSRPAEFGTIPINRAKKESKNKAVWSDRQNKIGETLLSLMSTMTDVPEKITGMLLLALEISELIDLVNDVAALKMKVKEAEQVLNEYKRFETQLLKSPVSVLSPLVSVLSPPVSVLNPLDFLAAVAKEKRITSKKMETDVSEVNVCQRKLGKCEPKERPGDITCNSCGGNNFDLRTNCYRCNSDLGLRTMLRHPPPSFAIGQELNRITKNLLLSISSYLINIDKNYNLLHCSKKKEEKEATRTSNTFEMFDSDEDSASDDDDDDDDDASESKKRFKNKTKMKTNKNFPGKRSAKKSALFLLNHIIFRDNTISNNNDSQNMKTLKWSTHGRRNDGFLPTNPALVVVMRTYVSRLLVEYLNTFDNNNTYQQQQRIEIATNDIIEKLQQANERITKFKQKRYTRNCGHIVWNSKKQKLVFDAVATKLFYSQQQDYSKKISTEKYQRMMHLYHVNGYSTDTTQDINLFHNRLYSCLQRYETFTILDPMTANKGTQGSLPKQMFQVLNLHFNCQHECFASPLNCTYDSFGTIFPDVDCYFGGKQSFSDFQPVSGCMEVNPPFDKLSVVEAFEHCGAILEANENETPLLFVVFTPFVANHKWMKHLIEFKKNEHFYYSGMQQHLSKSKWTSTTRTCVSFLCNDTGYNTFLRTKGKRMKIDADIKKAFSCT